MKVWVYLDGRQQGPFEFEELRSLPVTPDTKVWFDGLPKWYPAGSLPEMAPLFEESAPQTCDYADRQPETAEDAPRANDNIAGFAEFRQPVYPEAAFAPAIAPMQAKPPCPPTYLGWSIALTILCCSPVTLGALVASILVNHYYLKGRLKAARTASQWAVWLVMASIALGLLPSMMRGMFF